MNHATYVPNFFTKNSKSNFPHFGENWTSVPFLVLDLKIFENHSKFFENGKFNAMFWIGKPCYMSPT